MTTPIPPTKIGTVLQHDDPIPSDATGILDRDDDPWLRTKPGHWHSLSDRRQRCDRGDCDNDDVEIMLMFVPLTVVAVVGFISPATQPRAPRVWSQIGEQMPFDRHLPVVVDVDAHGRWVLDRGSCTYAPINRDDVHGRSLNELRLLGEVREVLS